MKYYKHNNYYILLADAIAYSVFFTLWNTSTVIPVFLDQIQAPPWTIGAINTLKQILFILPQLVMAIGLSRIYGLVGFIRSVIMIDRPQLLIFLLCLPIMSKTAILPVFFACFSIFCFGEGLVLVPWLDLLSRTVGTKLRSRLLGSIQIWAGLASLIFGTIISLVIENRSFPYPANFLIIFGLGTIILLPPLFMFKKAENPIMPWKTFGSKFPCSISACLTNRNFLTLLLVQILVGASILSLPFYIVIVRHRFSWLAPVTGTYIFLNIAGTITGGIIWGLLSQKAGNRMCIICSSFCHALTSLVFLYVLFEVERILITILLGIGFILAGIAAGGWVGFTNYLLDIATDSNRPFYIAINNTAMLPVALLPALGGLIRLDYGDLFLYCVTSIFIVLGFILSFCLKETRFR